jgi:hypothetical protein
MEYGCKGKYMKEIPRRGLRLCRLLITTCQLLSRVAGGGRYFGLSHPFLEQAYGQILEDDVNGFPSTSDISFMG